MGMSANPSCFAQFRVSPPLASAPLLRVLPGGRQGASTTPATPEPIECAPESRTFRLDANSPDDVLAIAACGGNHHAASIIVRRYTSKVRSRLHQWMGPVDIDDHVQDAFIRLFEQLPRLRDPSALRGFLVGITFRVACTELRRRRRSRTRLTVTGDVPEPRMTNDDSEPAREALWRFESILSRLSPRSRRVFMLRYVEKLELTDVAEEMRISVATAKRHFARASAAVSAMVKREPALAEYLPLAHDESEVEISRATA
jgi:RNA polymerase sigma-70 factor (ECF subfamily)